jgi:tetratricopeptide (TPR) repeat protein
MKFRNLTFTLFVAMLVAVSCVSKKQYLQQTENLESTNNVLQSQIVAQDLLKSRVITLEDSVNLLKKQQLSGQINTEFEVYKTALVSGDRTLAASSLVRLIALDPAQGYWAYDSLSFYHYLYLFTPGLPRQSQAALYFTNQGLSMNPTNAFLLETKAKLYIELGKDSASYDIFKSLWDKYGDYTYLWEMTYVDLYIFENIKRVEAVIAEVVKNKESEVYKVRVEQLEEHIIESIPAKAAFLYLRAILQNAQGQSAKSKKTLEEVIKIAPSFLSAQRALYQIKNPQYH